MIERQKFENLKMQTFKNLKKIKNKKSLLSFFYSCNTKCKYEQIAENLKFRKGKN